MSSGRSGSARWEVAAPGRRPHAPLVAGVRRAARAPAREARSTCATSSPIAAGCRSRTSSRGSRCTTARPRGRWTVCFDLSDGKWLTGPRPRIADVVFKRSYDPAPRPARRRDRRTGAAVRARTTPAARATRVGWCATASRRCAPRVAGARPPGPPSWRVQRMVWPFKQPAAAGPGPPPSRTGVVGHPPPRVPVRGRPPTCRPSRSCCSTPGRGPRRSTGVADHHTGPNFQRAELIRTLQRRLGPRFRGGFAPSPYAREHFPDCLSDQPTEPVAYMQAVQRCAIAVSTIGLQRLDALQAAREPLGVTGHRQRPAPLRSPAAARARHPPAAVRRSRGLRRRLRAAPRRSRPRRPPARAGLGLLPARDPPRRPPAQPPARPASCRPVSRQPTGSP